MAVDPDLGPLVPTTAAASTSMEGRLGHHELAEAAIAEDCAQQAESATNEDAIDDDLDAKKLPEEVPLLQNKAPNCYDPGVVEAANGASDEAQGEQTNWRREAKVISRYTAPMIPTFLLQYSLVATTMISIGHLGTTELGAASLGAMSASVTGNAIISGLTTSLDTLCAQAYGSGRRSLVGLQVQRMVYFLWLCTLLIGVLWLYAPVLLRRIIPEAEIAELTGRYLRIVWFSVPGFAMFSAGKRFFQAQGNFSASLFVIMLVAPLNAFLNWFLVWHLGWGFDGAPISVVISTHCLWICQVGYVYFSGGQECWPGFTRQAFRNWGPMIRLAIPGCIMLEAEVFAFEGITVASSYFGTVALAANSVLLQAINVAFQIPFPLAIATSTRIAHLIGAGSVNAAKVSARVGLSMAFAIGVLNVIIFSLLRDYIPRIFSGDPEVWKTVAQVLPQCAVVLLFDAACACCNGILRGLGRQSFGSYVQLICFYVIGLPISFGTAFGAHWELHGLWAGLLIY